MQPLLVWEIIDRKLGLAPYYRVKGGRNTVALLRAPMSGKSLWSFAPPPKFLAGYATGDVHSDGDASEAEITWKN